MTIKRRPGRLTRLFSYASVEWFRIVGLSQTMDQSPAELADATEEVREQKLQFIVGSLELLLPEAKGMPNSERATVAKALSA